MVSPFRALKAWVIVLISLSIILLIIFLSLPIILIVLSIVIILVVLGFIWRKIHNAIGPRPPQRKEKTQVLDAEYKIKK
ncbi:hypothetical protein HYV86_02200 [Candidatus Woesearchaeota archaeon]|nr:hypothetical protein [Candidatus Woesearchaeota archaeon]